MSSHLAAFRLAALALLAALSLSRAEPAHGQDAREYTNARSASDGAVLPFSGAVRVGETL